MLNAKFWLVVGKLHRSHTHDRQTCGELKNDCNHALNVLLDWKKAVTITEILMESSLECCNKGKFAYTLVDTG